MIRFHCNKCGKAVKAPDKYAGKKVKCPNCQSTNLLPSEKEVLPYQLEVEEIKYEGIFCHQCGNQIKKEAMFCPKCGCENIANKNNKMTTTTTETEIGPGTIVASYILAILFPLLGFIAGIYLVAKKEPAHGVACILVSIFVGFPIGLAMLGAF
jgi:DNA-directed RNA polymerase subunit RPC12/RpoP